MDLARTGILNNFGFATGTFSINGDNRDGSRHHNGDTKVLTNHDEETHKQQHRIAEDASLMGMLMPDSCGGV